MRHFFIFLLVFITGCSSNISGEFETIHIKKNIVDAICIDDIFAEYTFVGLEATDSSLVDPWKVVLKNDVIYVSDRGKLFQFAVNGDHLKTLDRRGRGPQEYLGISDFTVSDKEIIIWDRNGRTLFRYSLDNKYIDSYKLDDYISTIYIIDKNRILLSSAYSRNDEYKFRIRDLETMDLITSFYPIEQAHTSYRHFIGETNYYVHNNALLFHESMNNYVYKIKNQKLSPIYYIDMYGRNPPNEFWNREYEDVREVRKIAQERGYCFGIPMYAESDNQILFSFEYENKSMLCSYLKETGESIQWRKIILFQNMPAVQSGWIGKSLDSKDHFLVLESEDFFDDNGRPYVEELSHLSNNGNPVICIAKLK